VNSRRVKLSITATAFALLLPSLAQAQSEEFFIYHYPGQQTAFDTNLFEPTASARAIFSIERAQIPSHLTFTAGLWASYANSPFVARIRNGTNVRTVPIVSNDLRAELHASLGLFQFIELTVAMPVALTTHARAIADGQGGLVADFRADGGANSTTALATSIRAGDLRAAVKIPILRGAWELGGRVAFTIPTGSVGIPLAEAGTPTPCQDGAVFGCMSGSVNAVSGNAFSSSYGWTFLPQLLLSRQFGSFLFAANLGYHFREKNGLAAGANPFIIDDEIRYGVGGRYALSPRLALGAELNGRLGILNAFNSASHPLDLVVGAQISASSAVNIDIGVRRGLTGGYGSEQFGAFVGLRVGATGRTCEFGPEDYDGFQDGDYCEDPDNDRDGILDAQDRCPNDAEDVDGVLDEDGCPDPDNDGDGFLDDVDRCPIEPEDRDGNADDDGCPDPDNDGDHVPDVRDQCVNDPEDLDNYEDEDGCPEPGPQAVQVTRQESRLLLSQRIYFEYDSDVIRNVSFDILNEVAATLRRNPDIAQMRIEGHTDSQGDPQYNLDLSYRRARAVVEYLSQRGVERSRLDFRGYGSQRAGVETTEDDRALNRRVEFIIVSQGSAPTTSTSSPAPATTPPPPRPRGRRSRGAR
jgi:outer membrane protein OmpA-like peptidoglycan-associated protein